MPAPKPTDPKATPCPCIARTVWERRKSDRCHGKAGSAFFRVRLYLNLIRRRIQEEEFVSNPSVSPDGSRGPRLRMSVPGRNRNGPLSEAASGNANPKSETVDNFVAAKSVQLQQGSTTLNSRPHLIET